QPRPGFRGLAPEAIGRSGIDHLRAPRVQRVLHVREHGDRERVHFGFELTLWTIHFAGLGWPAFRLPARQPAVENEHAPRTENVERPPDARRRTEAHAIIDDNGIVPADAEFS